MILFPNIIEFQTKQQEALNTNLFAECKTNVNPKTQHVCVELLIFLKKSGPFKTPEHPSACGHF